MASATPGSCHLRGFPRGGGGRGGAECLTCWGEAVISLVCGGLEGERGEKDKEGEEGRRECSREEEE